MSFNKIITFLLFIICSASYAQKFELGKVSIDELKEKVHPKDSSAVAAILFKKCLVTYDYSYSSGFTRKTEISTRIKIYKKEGYDWANHKINYYTASSPSEGVSVSSAVTYNLVNGKIEKSKLKSNGEFDEKINKFWNQKKITMPNVKEGSIIEYKYTILTPGYGSFRDWDFQAGIPVNNSELVTKIPDFFVYNVHYRGALSIKPVKVVRSKAYEGSYQEMTSKLDLTDSGKGTYKIPYDEVTCTYTLKEIPALNEEQYVNNINNYKSSVMHELASERFPNKPYKNYATDWATVTKTIYDNEDFGSELNKTGYFEEDLNAVIAGLTSKEEKIGAIFNYVKSRIKWNDYYGYNCIDGVKTAYKNKTGNVAEINLMLIAMLRYANVNANPVLVSTRSNGIAFFPNTNAYNYVISAVEFENGLVLLDATEKFSTPDILPIRDLNWFGRLIRKDGSSTEVDLNAKTISKEVTNMTVTLNADGSAKGMLRKQVSDHVALSFRQNYVNLSNDTYLEKLESSNDNIEIADYKRENELDLSKPLVETYSFKDNKNIEIIGDKMYISPLLFLNVSENPFKQEKREYPIDFGYPTQDKYNVIIEIPEGYAIESLPQTLNLVTGDNIGAFKYIIGNNGNKIQVQIVNDINVPIVSSEYYDVLKEFFQKMVDKQNEKIVLKKA